jgi:hypothetical protein
MPNNQQVSNENLTISDLIAAADSQLAQRLATTYLYQLLQTLDSQQPPATQDHANNYSPSKKKIVDDIKLAGLKSLAKYNPDLNYITKTGFTLAQYGLMLGINPADLNPNAFQTISYANNSSVMWKKPLNNLHFQPELLEEKSRPKKICKTSN